MDRSERDRLNGLIDQLDAEIGPELSPRDGELLLGDILEPLLAEDGFTVVRTSQAQDGGVDFVAQKQSAGDRGADSLAVEYKHLRGRSVGLAELHQLLGAAISMGASRAMLVTNSRFNSAVRTGLRANAPVAIELMDLDALRSWVGRLEQVPEVNLSQVNIIRRLASRLYIEQIAKNAQELGNLEWREMEHLLAEAFEGLGFDAKVTPGSGDGGKDIVLTCRVGAGTHTYYVEVKHWRSGQGVGGAMVKDFVNVVVNEEVNGGLFLSSYGFCSNAIESLTEVERRIVRMGAENKVVSLCKTYVKAMSGIWSPEALPDMLFENTL